MAAVHMLHVLVQNRTAVLLVQPQIVTEEPTVADATIYCPKPGSTWQHRKGGHYTVLCVARVEATMEHVVVYHKTTQPADAWTRPVAEFMDGRFTPTIEN